LSWARRGKCSLVTWPVQRSRFMPYFIGETPGEVGFVARANDGYCAARGAARQAPNSPLAAESRPPLPCRGFVRRRASDAEDDDRRHDGGRILRVVPPPGESGQALRTRTGEGRRSVTTGGTSRLRLCERRPHSGELHLPARQGLRPQQRYRHHLGTGPGHGERTGHYVFRRRGALRGPEPQVFGAGAEIARRGLLPE